jgi:hypothetical protein
MRWAAASVLAYALLFGLSVAACSNDLDALYGDGVVKDAGAMDSGPRSRPPPTPYEAAIAIYGHEPTCVACVENSCGDVARACADGEACRVDTACRVGCTGNPWCEYDCYQAQPKGARPTSALEDCILSACAGDCRAGQSFDCVGKHNPPRPSSAEPPAVTWHVIPGLVPGAAEEAQGLRLRLCLRDDIECAAPVAEEFTDADGMVRLEYPAARVAAGSLVAFDGYIEVTDTMDPPRFLPAIVIANTSVTRSVDSRWPFELTVAAQSDLDLIAGVSGTAIDAAAGFLGVAAYDCRASDRLRAVGLTYELAPAQDETRWLYGLDRGARSTLSDPQLSGVAFALPVEPGFVVVTTSYERSTVSSLDRVPIREGTVTQVVLFPE